MNTSTTAFALRVFVMLAAVTPLFAATAFHPAWWQTLIAAVIGSAVGQVAVRLTRDRRLAMWAVMAVAAIIAGGAGAWSLVHTSRHDRAPTYNFLVVRSQTGARPSLTWDDVTAIQSEIPTIHLVVPYLHKMVQVTGADANWNTEVVGTTPDYFELRSMHVAAGELFGASESSKVVVLGDTVVTQLYGARQNPVGETVRIGGMPFTVIGVLAHQSKTPEGQDLDDVAIVPVQVYTSKFEPRSRFGGAVLISPASPGDAPRVEAQLRELLRVRHRLDPSADDDFVIRAPASE